MRGHLQPTQFDNEINRLKEYLALSDSAHFQELPEAWTSANLPGNLPRNLQAQ